MRGCCVALLASVAAFVLPVSPAFGEGSVDLNTGPEPNTRHGLFQNDNGSYTILYVYAQAGETIQLGSSALGVAGAGNIAVYNPGTNLNGLPFPSDPAFSNDVFDCDTDDPGTGVIAVGTAGRDQEIAGPDPTGGDADPDTWVPCEYTPTTTGLFPVIMFPPNTGASAGVGTVENPAQGAGGQIAIWDVTVRDSADAVQLGRTFADQYYLSEIGTGGGGVEVFVYTRTGYEYQVNLFNHDGVNWNLRADDQGVVTTPGGERLFASFDCRLNTTDPANFCTDTRAGFAPPESRYPMFLNDPAAVAVSGPSGLGATRGYATAPITPASQPVASTFTGSGGQAGATNHGSGGTINVTAPTQMAGLGSTLEIDINGNGVWGDAPDYVDTQDLEADGSNAYAWAGRDAAGNQPACGDYQYRVRSTLAEVHFPMVDVETSGGTQIQRLTLPTDTTLGNAFTAYYDDRDPFKGRNVTDVVPIEELDGALSNPTFHAWGDLSDPLGTGGGDTDYIDTWVQLPEVASPTQTLRLLCADPQVLKTAEPAPIVPGEDATFKLAVTNNGPDAATNVSVTDDLPDTVRFESASDGCSEAGSVVTCGLASLAPGATHTFEIVVAVPSSLSECIENSATVTNTMFDTNLANNTSEDCFEIEGRSNIGITKAASTATVPVGGQVMFTLVVRNNGPSDDPGVEVTDALPAGLTLVAAEPSQGTCATANNTVACDLGTLKDGGSAQVLVTVNTTAAAGCITNVASVHGAHEDPDPANNQASAQVCVEPPPEPPTVFDLEVDKRVNVSRPRVGQRVTYRIVVRNNGPGAAPEAKVTDTYNNRATLVSARTTQGSCTRRLPVTCELGRIEAGGSATITMVIKPLETGRARNAASATSCCGTDGDPGNNMDTADIRVRKVPLRLSKVADRSTVAAGETLSFRIRVRNPTRGEARNVRVCDRLPSGMAYVSSKPRARGTGRQHCWRIDRLGARKSRTYRVTVRVARGANGRRTNRATASSPDATATARARHRIRVLGVATPVTG